MRLRFKKAVLKLSAKNKRFFEDLERNKVRVGVVGNSFKSGNEITETGKAIANEYGTKNTPPRPFLRPVMYSMDYMEKAFREGLRGADVDTIGLRLAGDVKVRLTMMQAGDVWKGITIKPLSPATIRAKGGDKLLIKEGNMRGAITNELVRK